MIIVKGLPGSGKSTWAKEQLRREPERWKRINRDDLRGMFDDGKFSKQNEEFVISMQNHLIRDALSAGYDVIVDNTHLVRSTVNKLHKLAASIGDVTVIEKSFNVPVDVCIKRNAEREGRARVPENAIYNMAKGAGINRGRKIDDRTVFYADQSIQVVQDPSLPHAIVCDLDGTLALLNGRNPYDASKCDEDLLNESVAQCVLAMHAAGKQIIFMSGREDRFKSQTVKFIEKHLLIERDGDVTVMPYQLHMRSTNDTRRDSIIKTELFDRHIKDKFYVEFVLDDRDQVVQFWRSIGLNCFQVAEGNF